VNTAYYFLPAILAVALIVATRVPSVGPEDLLNASIALSAPLLIALAAGSGPAPPHYRFASSSLGGAVFRRLLPTVERLVADGRLRLGRRPPLRCAPRSGRRGASPPANSRGPESQLEGLL